MSDTTLCLPCTLALRPPTTETPHGCPGQLQMVSGTGQVSVLRCGCPVCWPERSADGSVDGSGQPLDDLGAG
ncbi:hypothetical protein [Plantactinospora sonchi]|uniref:Uncharacterized protein n=1 Tax=Plantactinospora sonchi TaxID=1544735 RepID=A0ABU7RPT3_9ACTN